ncbi:cellulase family glycosylhydrolase [Glaciibacter psychrotolerans]|uniref:Endoglycosylceramidase n=1 Tax=Glaciibacter psychrotolerans TaxID=670054 RepID=A0A7Z0J5I1_9MICO|nr:cellulase family glycosylhydrolase [Leifsonia psychrotolerans]NYJ19415.1 endoglycosylceramidase [Leifsonia psychrotolerans]
MNRARVFSLVALAALVVAGGESAFVRQLMPVAERSAITDTSGRALGLHGFSTAGSAKSSVDGLPRFTEADLARENADMGTNFVRFLISWRAVEPQPGIYDQAYLAEVETRVDWFAKQGYHVMLDMHQDLWGTEIVPGMGIGNGAPGWATYTDGLPIGQHDMWELYYLDAGVIRAFDNFWNTTGTHPELMDHYVNAWKAVATQFASNPTVIAYDLMNEPFGGTLQGPAFEAGPLTNLYQQSLDAIRTVDPDSWACLEPQAMGVNWGLPSGLGVVTDSRPGEARVAFCPHLYPLAMDLGGGYSGGSRDMVDATIASWIGNTKRTAARLGNVPIILGEFGLDTTLPGALDYVDTVYAQMDGIHAGVAYWSRDNGLWGPYDTDGVTARNLVAAIDRPYLRAVAGTLQTLSSAPDRLEFSFTPDAAAAAPTELYLPAVGFPHGAAVDGATIAHWDTSRRILTLDAPGNPAATQNIVVVAADG